MGLLNIIAVFAISTFAYFAFSFILSDEFAEQQANKHRTECIEHNTMEKKR